MDKFDDLIFRLRKKAEIRLQAKGRKSVEEGKIDRLSELLIEAADCIFVLTELFKIQKGEEESYSLKFKDGELVEAKLSLNSNHENVSKILENSKNSKTEEYKEQIEEFSKQMSKIAENL